NQYQSTNDNAYVNNQYQSANGNVYGNNPYQSVNDSVYGSNQYQSGNNYYGGNNSGNVYGNDYGKNQYQGNTNPYGSNQYQYGGNQYQYGGYAGSDYGYNNPYSPYAVPQKKKNTGLIIGVIIGIFVLFLIALFALFYHAFDTLNERDKHNDRYDYYDDYYDDYFDDYYDDYFDDYFYNYDDDYFYDYDPYDDYGYGYDYDFGGGYDDDYNYDADEYYTFHDDIKKDLSYKIEMEDFEYDTDNEDVVIQVEYPVIVGENVANLDKLNETIADEISVLTDYYEENFAESISDDDYFYAISKGYVAYMSEDVLSIAFEETIVTSGYYGKVKLNCINIDMKDGVIMDNTGIIDVNDDFSVDFRKRSDTQNGAISALTMMTDQQITKYLKSEDSLIIFYTPQGLEVGLNYGDGDGWVTVTYKDYEEFLKIF
ncbi:MAG: hypothetical protein J1E98_01695, partial [Lachnospiraceae bacterium]|nr:hypothetical protein [Lachnospiraceae bacterium]